MAIRNNKDFLREYKDDAWKGFSTRELLCIIGAAAIGIALDVLLHLYAGVSLAAGVYIALPAAAPLILVGFYKYQGFLTVGRLLKEWMYEMETSRMDYISGECAPKGRAFRMDAAGIKERTRERSLFAGQGKKRKENNKRRTEDNKRWEF